MDWSNTGAKSIKEQLSTLPADEFIAAWHDVCAAFGAAMPKGLSSLAKRAAEYERVDAMRRFDLACGSLTAGVDEAGRGPLAGPVYAAAVIFPPDMLIEGLNDSKKLTAKRRAELYDEITAKALAWRVESADIAEIEELNILGATLKAMAAAVKGLDIPPRHVLVDGTCSRGIGLPCTCVIKGDSKSMAVAAASILAKVSRDRYMDGLDAVYPQYGFAVHKGYGTAAHIGALRRFGASQVHRRTFIKNFEAPLC